jgi:hypothetical protein
MMPLDWIVPTPICATFAPLTDLMKAAPTISLPVLIYPGLSTSQYRTPGPNSNYSEQQSLLARPFSLMPNLSLHIEACRHRDINQDIQGEAGVVQESVASKLLAINQSINGMDSKVVCNCTEYVLAPNPSRNGCQAEHPLGNATRAKIQTNQEQPRGITLSVIGSRLRSPDGYADQPNQHRDTRLGRAPPNGRPSPKAGRMKKLLGP